MHALLCVIFSKVAGPRLPQAGIPRTPTEEGPHELSETR